MMVWNALLALAMVFYWSGLAAYIGEPVRWAMTVGVSLNPTLLEYPYVMLWIIPILCMVGGWGALKGNQAGIARILGIYPTLALVMMTGWFYLAPQNWH
jgi:hypothetical protein